MSFFHDAKAAKDTATTIRILALNYDQSRTNLNHDLVQTEGCVRITVVSGLPRSGTSLMMQMIVAGGISALTDGLRTADENNPKGYYEWAPPRR